MTATTTSTPTAVIPTSQERPPLRRLTKLAGSLYLAIFVVYPMSTLVRSSLVVPGDAAATADNIRAQETLFRWGMAGEATIVLVEIVLAAVLYALLRPVSRPMSLAASLARVAEAVVMAAGCLVTSVVTLLVVSNPGYLAAFEADQRDGLALLFQEANDDIVLVWGFFFALSLVLTGWLVHRSGFLPRLPGILLALAGVGHFVQSTPGSEPALRQEVPAVNAVRRTIAKAILVASLVGLVLAGLVAQAGAYLFGFTTPDLVAAGSTYSRLSHAAPGDHPVGVRRIGPEQGAPLKMSVWYPATASAASESPMTYSYALTVLGPSVSTALATYEGVGRLGAAPDVVEGPYPLVVLSSGFAITPGSYAWLAEHLASHGMVVVAPQHEETFDPRTLWRAAIDRVDDIAQTRAYVESEAHSAGALAGLVDPGTVAVVGHSYGGYTALASGGARLDADAFTAGCATAREDDNPIGFLCDALEPRFDQVVAANARGTVAGPRPVDAVVSLAGDAAMFGEPGLASLTAPLLVIGGTADDDSPYDWSTRLAYEGASSIRKVEVGLDGAEHFVFSGRCDRLRRITALVPMGFSDDPAWDRTRARAVIKHYVTAFLLTELADESKARTALSPGGPALPRVSYRTVGY